ncbi:hypothetical protein HDU98_004575 [Podochytrium sp. JEL0797]|nr:hypothetical protein HDU98_004575 [Podochytrium sp. JEL0797]
MPPTEETALLPTPPTPLYETFLDNGLLPDFILRLGIRHFLSKTANNFKAQPINKASDAKRAYIKAIKGLSTIALNTKEANEQHYEVPTSFFQTHLGPHMKYSCAFYNFENLPNTPITPATTPLAEAELAMLNLYCDRAQLKDGMSILELGCGWGSLCLFLAHKFPKSSVVALSNSNGQREHITRVARERGIKNLEVLTGDMNVFEFGGKREFDRIVSIEMFEHMKNYQTLFQKVSRWLVPHTGRLFVHVFCHKSVPYDFETEDPASDTWLARYFFSGGTMPSEDLFLWFQDHLKVENRWTVDGRNYALTCEHWLQALDANKGKAMEALVLAYGSKEEAAVWFNRWRVFYLSCAELFGFDGGREWGVVHYLFSRR